MPNSPNHDDAAPESGAGKRAKPPAPAEGGAKTGRSETGHPAKGHAETGHPGKGDSDFQRFSDGLSRLAAGGWPGFDPQNVSGTAETQPPPGELSNSSDGAPVSSTGPTGAFPRIGPYQLVRLLGEGGMGAVYLAEQTSPIRRPVALKLIKTGLGSEQIIARFERERQALALMNHENVAKVFAAGTTEDGLPYVTMEYVPGEPLTDFCDRHRLEIRARLKLFLSVCSAVQHAHDNGVIHRDLKPTNILVRVQGRRPIPKLIDFGIAKPVEQRLTERTIHTMAGQFIGTPAYMSPEQAAGVEIDHRSDIYSLGAILYELLTGTLPFSAEELLKGGLVGLERTLRNVDPPLMSRRAGHLGPDASRISRSRRTEPLELAGKLTGDLDSIAMRSLEKQPDRRYASARELASDVERHLADLPIVARAPTSIYRLRKFVTRNRGRVAAVAFAVLALAVGLVLSGPFRTTEQIEKLPVVERRLIDGRGEVALDDGVLYVRSLRDLARRTLAMRTEESLADFDWDWEPESLSFELNGGDAAEVHVRFEAGDAAWPGSGAPLRIRGVGTSEKKRVAIDEKFRVEVDRAPPSIGQAYRWSAAVDGPSSELPDGVRRFGVGASLRVQATDEASPLRAVRFHVAPAGSPTAAEDRTAIDGIPLPTPGSGEWSFPLRLSPGSYRGSIEAEDRAGNLAGTRDSAIEFVVDDACAIRWLDRPFVAKGRTFCRFTPAEALTRLDAYARDATGAPFREVAPRPSELVEARVYDATVADSRTKWLTVLEGAPARLELAALRPGGAYMLEIDRPKTAAASQLLLQASDSALPPNSATVEWRLETPPEPLGREDFLAVRFGGHDGARALPVEGEFLQIGDEPTTRAKRVWAADGDLRGDLTFRFPPGRVVGAASESRGPLELLVDDDSVTVRSLLLGPGEDHLIALRFEDAMGRSLSCRLRIYPFAERPKLDVVYASARGEGDLKVLRGPLSELSVVATCAEPLRSVHIRHGDRTVPMNPVSVIPESMPPESMPPKSMRPESMKLARRFELVGLHGFELVPGAVEFEVRAVDLSGNLLTHVSSVTFAETEDAPAAAPDRNPAPAWVLPEAGYAETLATHDIETDRLGDLEVSVAYIRNGFHYALARDVDRIAARAGAHADLDAVLEDVYRRSLPFKGKRFFLVRWRRQRDPDVPRFYFFLPRFSRHIRASAAMIEKVDEISPELRVQRWTVFDHGARSRGFRQQLLPIPDGLSFVLTAKPERRRRKTIELKFGGIVQQQQRSKDEKNTIKPDVWQIACPDWDSLQGALEVSFLEALPAPNPPVGFEALVQKLEERFGAGSGRSGK